MNEVMLESRGITPPDNGLCLGRCLDTAAEPSLMLSSVGDQ
jgi:hypothetical protein